MSQRPRHAKKDVEEVLQEVEEAAGWVVQYPSGHWGRVRCAGPSGDFEGLDYCRITIGSTPRSPSSLI